MIHMSLLSHRGENEKRFRRREKSVLDGMSTEKLNLFEEVYRQRVFWQQSLTGMDEAARSELCVGKKSA